MAISETIDPAGATSSSRRLDYVPCNLCGSDEHETLFASTITEYDLARSPSQFSITRGTGRCGQIVRCGRCGLVFVNPREDAREIMRSYTLVRDEDYLREEKARRSYFMQGLRLIERYRPSRGRLLDIGCFVGLFADAARRRGWSVFGIEPSRWAVDYARGHLGFPIVQGSLEQADLEDGSFDVVTLWDVIEHLLDPRAALSLVHRKLAQGGILFINTLDFDSIYRRVLGRRFWFIERKHVYYFSRRTLTMMLNACDYEVVRITSHFKVMGLEYLCQRLHDAGSRAECPCARVRLPSWLKRLIIPLYLGQMTVIARKRG